MNTFRIIGISDKNQNNAYNEYSAYNECNLVCLGLRFEQHWHISKYVDQKNNLNGLVHYTTYPFAEQLELNVQGTQIQAKSQ